MKKKVSEFDRVNKREKDKRRKDEWNKEKKIAKKEEEDEWGIKCKEEWGSEGR